MLSSVGLVRNSAFRSTTSQLQSVRFQSSEIATKSSGGGAGFFQRLTSFIIGAGVTALGTQYYIHTEIVEGNKVMLEKQKAIEKRLSVLEKK